MANWVTVMQLNSQASWQENKAVITALFAQLPAHRPQLVVLPEAFSHFGAGEAQQGRYAEIAGQGEVQEALAKLAQQHQVWVVAGTIPVKATVAKQNHAAASLLFNDQGEQLARYDKIHLFDAAVADATKTYRESVYTTAGHQVVCVPTPFGKLGLAVCYDVRFPELFRALRQQGAELVSLPSAFTRVTGAAHWQPLLQARAIENQFYLLAANQWGQHSDGRQTWGHSMIVDPWGQVVAQQAEGVGCVSAALDMNLLRQIRLDMPVIEHNKFEVTFLA